MNKPKWSGPHETLLMPFFFIVSFPVTPTVAFSAHAQVSYSIMGQCFIFLLLLNTHLL